MKQFTHGSRRLFKHSGPQFWMIQIHPIKKLNQKNISLGENPDFSYWSTAGRLPRVHSKKAVVSQPFLKLQAIEIQMTIGIPESNEKRKFRKQQQLNP